jgi:phenylalanyl-tRNA synthetase beta chain
MKVSVAWLEKYFAEPLPSTEELVDILTFHSSEVEEVIGEGEKTVLDVKVLPDRAAYALSHRGLAYELAASLDRKMSVDPLREELPPFPTTDRVNVSIESKDKCARYMGALVEGVKIGPSPEWLKKALETVGQRSINNVVDATNYVMLNIGQPLHAFDASKLKKNADGQYCIGVRGAFEGETIITLTGEEYGLIEDTLVITDRSADAAIGIAGIKGGKRAEVDANTTDIIVESANFDGTTIRRAAQSLKLFTDASSRFQNKISPELASYGMRDVLALILEVAGGAIAGVADCYPAPEPAQSPVSVTRDQLNGMLGTGYSMDEITSALDRLSLEHVAEGEMITVRPPFERRDIVIWQDLVEEAGRMLGYDRVPATALPAMPSTPDQSQWKGIEVIKDLLTERGFTEISTQSFAADGEIQLANPLQQERPWLRASLSGNMEEALARAAAVAPLVLGPEPALKLFELGTVFKKDGEHLSLALGYRPLSGKSSGAVLQEAVDALMEAFPAAGITRATDTGTGVAEISLKDAELGNDTVPSEVALGPFKVFSIYPFALRDIAVWTPSGTEESEAALLIQKEAGELLVRMDLFDRFEKEERISYAYRLVFQADDRTLSDTDLDPVMERITAALNKNEGWEVR